MSPDLLTQACHSAFLPHSRGLLAEGGQGEVRGGWFGGGGVGRGSLCLVLGQDTGKLASENLPLHRATCQPCPLHSLTFPCSPELSS